MWLRIRASGMEEKANDTGRAGLWWGGDAPS